MGQVSVEKTGITQVTITVRVPYVELSPLLPKAAAKISEETEIEGFRKGYAPYEVVKQRVGEFRVLEEAAKVYIQENFEKILEDIEDKEYRAKGISFEPMGAPEVTITKLVPGDELEFKITLAVLPPIELPDYKAIAKRVLTTKRVEPVTDKEVESSLAWLRESRSKLITVERPAQSGDRVEIDFSGTLDGVKVEGLESKNHPLVLGRGRFIPGFEQELVGMRAGESKTFTLDVPAGYHAKDIAGKRVEFKTEMKLVEEREVPEWDDAFVKSLGRFASIAEAETSVREGLKMEHEERERDRLRIKMLEEIAAETKAELPEVLILRELEKMIAELQDSISRMGMEFKNYLATIKKTEEDLKREWREDASRRVKIALVLREISRREGVQPSAPEVEAAINRTIERLGLTAEQTKELDPVRGKPRPHVGAAAPLARASNGVDREAFLDYNRGIARNEKVLQFLEDLVVNP